MAARCGAPVTVPGVFTAHDTDLGRRCVRAADHDGPHRWQPRWEALPPDEVEAEIARDLAAWEGEEEDTERDTAD